MTNRQPEKISRFLVYCEICAYKKIFNTDKPDDLVQIKTSAIQTKIPTLTNPSIKTSNVVDIDTLTSQGWKKVDGDGKTNLVFELNGQTKTLVSQNNQWKESVVNIAVMQQKTKVKCPSCGRGVVVKSLPDVYSKSYDEIDKKMQKAKEEYEKKKRIEDGTPIKYNPPEFLG